MIKNSGMHRRLLAILFAITISAAFQAKGQILPVSFDLRSVNGESYVSSIKSQTGGTCWTHAVMAAMESNLMMSLAWQSAGDTGEPNLAEYHLDWWNGYNKFYNSDLIPPYDCGLTVHQGGDYLVATAYLARGDGAVRDIDGQSYDVALPLLQPGFRRYYPNHVEWLSTGSASQSRERIKRSLMDYGAVGTCMAYSLQFMGAGYIHYQPDTSQKDPNHAVAIVGWDDQKSTQAQEPGAWLCKNSWGDWWGNQGFFWISYSDKHCARHPEMGAIQYRDVELFSYDRVYSHDYHGWRDTKDSCSDALNLFVAEARGQLAAVSFYTSIDSVNFIANVYDYFDQNGPFGLRAAVSGFFSHRGLHTVAVDQPVDLWPQHTFIIRLRLSRGGQAYDRTSEVPVLLGSKGKALVRSTAQPGQSFYLEGSTWQDLYSLDSTANFCMKGLAFDSCLAEVGFDYKSRAYPNPFRDQLRIETLLEKPSLIQASIYDILGRKKKTISIGYQTTGWHNFLWDGRGEEGRMLPAGVYICQVKAGGRIDQILVVKSR